jgi:hypothetical protein
MPEDKNGDLAINGKLRRKEYEREPRGGAPGAES